VEDRGTSAGRRVAVGSRWNLPKLLDRRSDEDISAKDVINLRAPGPGDS
jgi:hypothetical protein